MIDLRLLRVFLAISDNGSMTAAAQQLGLTQSAVSQSIRQLEDELKVTLIARAHRPLQLTSAGIALKQRAAALVQEAAQLPRLLQELGRSKMPEIRIGIVDSFAATVGPPLIKELMKSTVHLSVYSGLGPSHAESLMQRSLDLAIMSDAMEDVDGLERHPLLREPFILVAPREWASRISGKTLAQLATDMPLVRYSARSQVGRQIDRHLRRLNVTAPRVIEIDTSDALVAMVAGGLGWAITTPLCLLQGRTHVGGVAPLRLPGPGFTRTMNLMARSGEFAELPAKIADQARRIIGEIEANEIRSMIPWLSEGLVVTDEEEYLTQPAA